MLAFKRKKTFSSFTEGPLFFRMFLYAIPIILSGMLQLLYNAADNVVIGQFSDNPNSLAAVGSTASLTNLLVNMLFGLSVGTGVSVGRAIGQKNKDRVSDSVHTSVLVSIIGGILVGILGVLLATPMLKLLGTKPEVLDSASLYMKIFFCGMPANSVYNFGAAVLRARGDTKRPMIILCLTGIVNVVCNLFFVIFFHMDVAGVALATIIAQYISAAAVIILLCKEKSDCRLDLKRLRFNGYIFKELVQIGVPSGIQGMLFSISNALIQSAVNTFPTVMVNGNTVATTIEGFVYIAMNSYYHTALTFVSQNYGAGKFDRIKRTVLYAYIQVTVIGISLGLLALFFGKEISLLIKNNPEIAAASVERLAIILPTYFTCGLMEVATATLRSLGRSTLSMLSCVIGVCVVRMGWVRFIFPLEAFNSAKGLYISYPISWLLTASTLFVAMLIVIKKSEMQFRAEKVLK